MTFSFNQRTPLFMPLDDDIPQAPGGAVTEAAPTTEAQADFETPDIPQELYDSIPEEAETMKTGTYHFRLHSYKKKLKDGQPYFELEWACQQEPYTGRRTWDNVTGVTIETVRDAADNNSPNCQNARKVLNNRMWKQKLIMKQAGAKGMNFETFLQTNPELRIAGDKAPRMKASGKFNKDGSKIYAPDGTKTTWKVKEYLPL